MATNPHQPSTDDKCRGNDRGPWQFGLRHVLSIIALVAIVTGVFTQEAGSVTFMVLLAALAAWCFLVSWDGVKTLLDRMELSIPAYTLAFLTAHFAIIAATVLACFVIITLRSAP